MTYDPWKAIGERPDVEVLVTRLPAGSAWWLPDDLAIVLDDRLTQAGRRSALAHEVEHVEAGDTCCRIGPDGGRLSRRQERRTDERAARRLIPLDALADVLVWAWHTGEIAQELHVDEETVCVRIERLTDDEKQFIESRIAAKGDAA